MGQDIIANALPFLSMLLINISPVSPSATIKPHTATKPPEKIVWEVKENETLGGIAQTYYGDNKYWKLIAQDNPWLKNTNAIDIGWKLTLRKLPLETKIVEEIEREKNRVQIELSKVPQFASVQIQAATTPEAQTTPTPPSNYDEVYKEAGAKYGIPWQILYGLHLTETGLRNGTIFNGSGSGARGPMQFMPGTFNAYGVDGDGDGNANIDDAKDAIHSAANFLAKHGSLSNGLRSYGGNTPGVLAAARSRGFTQ